MDSANSSTFRKVKKFCELVKELQPRLLKSPNDWPKYQVVFDSATDQICLEIQKIEEENANNRSKLNDIKKLFEKEYRSYFLYGKLVKWSFKKPFGYPGDFKIIDDIYQNQPRTTGLDRLYDNHFLQLAASKATRGRKEDFKEEIFKFIEQHRNEKIRIMNLGSGSAREIKELLERDYGKLFSKVIFDCYDFDIRAINYAKRLLNNTPNVNFFEKHAIRLAFTREIKKEISWQYDLIYSTGLFDYFDNKFATKLVSNLKNLLKKEGIMMISNYRERFNNPSACLMEWVSEWCLIYRAESEFCKIFLDAKFSQKDLKIVPQKSKVMQYCFATLR